MSGITRTIGGLFEDSSGPTAPEPVAAPQQSAADKLVAAEEARTEKSRIDTIQRQLALETASRGRGYGIRSLFGALGSSGRTSLLGSG